MSQRNILVVIILLLFFALWVETSEAATLATKPNKAGGIIVLTDIKCESKSGMVAYSSSPTNTTAFGCWFFDENFVHIQYNDGDVRSYPKAGWFFPKTGVTTGADKAI